MNTEQIALADEVLTQIDLHPQSWDQEQWRNPCGCGGCFAGWLVEMDPEVSWAGTGSEYVRRTDGERWPAFVSNYGYASAKVHVRRWAQWRLGLTHPQAERLFHSSNTRQDLEDALDAIREGEEDVSVL